MTIAAPSAAFTFDDFSSDVPCVAEHAAQGEVLPRPFEGLEAGAQLPGRTLFTWLTVEEASAVAATTESLLNGEETEQGVQRAQEYLGTSFVPRNDRERSLLVLLTSESFAKTRAAWTHAWATRMGLSQMNVGSSEASHRQLLRLVIKPEARWVVVDGGQLWAVDNAGQPQDLQELLGMPSHIAGIYSENGAETNPGIDCGAVARESDPSRQFIVMNADMVESWSISAEESRQVVRKDIARLTEFFEAVRVCPERDTVDLWSRRLACSGWDGPSGGSVGDYERTLAMASADYLPRPSQVAAIINTLEQDLRAWTASSEDEAGSDAP